MFCHISFLSPCLLKTARYRLKYCLKEPLTQEQPEYVLPEKLCMVKVVIITNLGQRQKSV